MQIDAFISSEDLAALSQKSDVKAFTILITNWLILFSGFAIFGLWPNLLTFLMALVVIGGRQLALSIIMHECSHGTMFKTQRFNDGLGSWLAALPLFINLQAYRPIHRRHHRHAGSAKDPDLNNYKSYPVTKASLRRKFIRDLTGQSAFRQVLGVVKGSNSPLTQGGSSHGSRIFYKGCLAQLLLLVPFLLIGHPWLYLLWPLAYGTTFMLFLRIRQIAEHAGVPDLANPDPRCHTRTTYAGFWERLTVAPVFVNYHLDHHIWPQVPAYHLKKLHQRLLTGGAYDQYPPMKSYGAVLRRVQRL